MPLSKLRDRFRQALTLTIVFLPHGDSGRAEAVFANDQNVRTVIVEGVVKPLPSGEKSKDVPAGTDPKAESMAIFATDGREIVIADDEGGRMFYLDTAMRGREVRLRLIEKGGGKPAEVIQTEVRHEGRWRVPQYYCDVCTIAVRYPQVCLCCQGPMEFRYKPER